MTEHRRQRRAGRDRPLHEGVAAPGVRGPDGPEPVGVGGREPAEVGKRVEELAKQLEELEERAARAESERDEHVSDLKRLAADFDNYRKRAARDQASLVARAHERLVKELLPVLDDLERALETATEHEAARLEEGVRLVERELREALRREGLLEIETNGRFDPHVHEALLSQPSEHEEGSVLEVLQKGYRLGDRVLRPARVVISQGTPQPAEEEEEGR
jgi:molecular chaperone GrpE